MVTTLHFDLDIDTTLGGNNASDYVIASQKAIKSYVDNTGSTVDQTYDGTSTNAQSGVAIAGAGFLQNQNSIKENLSILGDIDTSAYSGYWYDTCIGAETGIVRGSANIRYCTCLGYGAKTGDSGAIQIGYGTNSTANSLSIGFYNNSTTYYNWQLLDGTTGLIPDARISSNIARTSAIPTVPTNISSFTNDSGYITGITSSDVTTALGYTPLQATNGNTAYTNTGTETTMGYTDTSANEMYGVIAGKNTTYGTGIILGAQNGGSGYMSTLTTSGLTIMNATNPPNIQTALLTVSNNNLAVNGSEVVTGDNTRFDGQWVDANEAIISSATSLSGSTALTKRITLPDDSHTYEVLIRGSIYTSSTSGKEVFLKVKGNEDSYDRYIARCVTRTNSSMLASSTTIVTASYVASNQTNLTIARDSSWSGNCSELTVVAYRRIGTNT